jgi:protein PhnA
MRPTMAKGKEKHWERLDKIAFLGKDLVRRAKSKCELCEGREGRLTTYEVLPLLETPSLERLLLLCANCLNDIEKNRFDQNRWHFLENVAWSELPAVQVTAIRICRNLNSQGVDWAKNLLETVYLAPEVEEWLDK